MVESQLENDEKVWTFAFAGFLFMAVVIMSGISVVVPVMPNIMRNFGVGASYMTAAFVALLVGRFFSSLLSGYILLKIQAHTLLFVAFILEIITMILLMKAGSGLMFTALRFMEGIFEGIISVLMQVIVIGMSSPKTRGTQIGYMQSAFGLGFIIGPAIGGMAMLLYGPQGVFGVTASLMVLCIIWLALIYRRIETGLGATPPQPLSFSLEFLKYIPYYGGPIIQRVLYVSFGMILPLFLVDRFGFEAYQTSYFFSMSAILTTTLMPISGKMGKTKYCTTVVQIAMMLMGLSILGMGLTSDRTLFSVFFIIETLGFVFMAPNAMKIFGDKVANHPRRGEIIGTSSSFRELVNIAVSFCIIPIYEYNMTLPWIILPVLVILLSLPYLKKEMIAADSPARDLAPGRSEA